jgi:hypothetical protein
VPQSCIVPLPLLVGPDGPVDDGDIPTLQPCLPPVLCTGVAGQSWRSAPPGWTVWSMDSCDGGHAGVGSTVQSCRCLTEVIQGVGDTGPPY